MVSRQRSLSLFLLRHVFSCNSNVIIFDAFPCSTYSSVSTCPSCGHINRTKDFDSIMADITKSLCHCIVSCLYAWRPHQVQDNTGVHAQLTSHHDFHLFHCLCYEDGPSLSGSFPPDTAQTALVKLYWLFAPIVLAIRPSCGRDLSGSLFNMAPNVMSSANFIIMILCFLPCH